MLAAMGTPAAIGLSEFDATAVIEIAVAVARQASAEEVSSFLRTGRLPEVLRLTPRQMEHVRGGRTNLTASRGIAPELVVEAWVRRIETP